MQKYTEYATLDIPSDISEISTLRSQLLKGIPANKKKKKSWLQTWNQLQKSAACCQERRSDKDDKDIRITEIMETLRQPWMGQCSTSEILAWRDHLYQHIDCESSVVEEQDELLMCQDLCQPESRTGRKVARVGL